MRQRSRESFPENKKNYTTTKDELNCVVCDHNTKLGERCKTTVIGQSRPGLKNENYGWLETFFVLNIK